MSAVGLEVVRRLKALGVALRVDGSEIVASGNTSQLTPPVVAEIRVHKEAVVAALLAQKSDAHDAHDTHDNRYHHNAPAEHAPELSPCASCVSCASEPGRIFIDFETRSAVALDIIGGRNYAHHPTTEVLCMIARLPDGAWVEWEPGQPPPSDLFSALASATLVAHNAHGFDRFIWERLGWPSADWIDTLPLARLAGFPGALEALGEIIGTAKDLEGRDFTRRIGRIDPRTGSFPALTAEDRARIRRYCVRDVEVLHAVWHALLTPFVALEIDTRHVDACINERGFAFDVDLAAAVIDCCDRIAAEERRNADVAAEVLTSPVKLKKLLHDAGVDVANIRRDTLEEHLDDPDLPDDVRRIIVARLASSNIIGHKLRAALASVSPDGRLRDALVLAAAHTGRWSGRRFQPQNLPRGVTVEGDADAILERLAELAARRDVAGITAAAAELGATLKDTVATLVRACVCAPPERLLGVVDYSSIEARALAWLAGDKHALDAFRKGEDPYKRMASILFRVPVDDVTTEQRLLGKVLVLGCGYQMGPVRFEAHAANCGVDWSKLDVTPATAVEAWRDAHPLVAGERWSDDHAGRIGGLWNRMESAAITAMHARGALIRVGHVSWRRSRDSLVCLLPSGRPMIYRRARVEQRPTPWHRSKATITYERFGGRVATYSGKLVENVTQAVCRDLLADALVRLERKGIPPVLHVHDEVVAEIADVAELDEMAAEMSIGPDWVEGLPLAVKKYVARRYRK